MSLPWHFLPVALAHSGAATNAARITEVEMLQRFPVLRATASILFLLGLACDVFLVARLTGRRREPLSGRSLLSVPPKPWGLLELVLVTGGLICLLTVQAAVLQGLVRWRRLTDIGATSISLIGELSLRLVVLMAVVAYLEGRAMDWQQAFGLAKPTRWRGIVLGTVFYLAVLPPMSLVFVAYTQLSHYVGLDQSPQPVAELLATTRSGLIAGLLMAFAVVVAPLTEELFFRGFAYPAMKQRWGAWRALVVVSAIFALIHFHKPSLAPLFTLAMGLGLAYEWTGSLWAPITMHALFNTTNVIMLLYVRFH